MTKALKEGTGWVLQVKEESEVEWQTPLGRKAGTKKKKIYR